MPETIELMVPCEPVAAARPRVSKWGTYYPKKYKDFKAELTEKIKELWGNRAKIAGPIQLSIWLHCTKPRTSKLDYPMPDVDNFAKAVMDSANDIIFDDDKQVVDLSVSKRWVTLGQPGVSMTIIKK